MIYKTTNYDQFKLMKGNRVLNQNHVAKLKKEIRRHNLLLACPVIVNEKFQVIDGQHRIEVARQLGVPVYYVQEKGLTIADVVMLNRSQRKWTIWDYVELYIANGKEDYQVLKDFTLEHGLVISSGVTLLSKNSTTNLATEKFRSGEFTVDNLEYAETIVSYMQDLKPHLRLPGIYTDSAFAAAVKRTDRILDQDYGGKSFEVVISAFTGTTDFIDDSGLVYEYMRSFENALKKNKKMVGIKLV